MPLQLKNVLIALIILCVISVFFNLGHSSHNEGGLESTWGKQYLVNASKPRNLPNVSKCTILATSNNFNSTRIEKATSNNSKVFIMSLPRSGSSFVGELFNQNEDYVYLYEVTRTLLPVGVCSESLRDESAEILRNAFSCDFRMLRETMDSHNWMLHASWDRAMLHSSKDRVDVCFPAETDSLATIKLRGQRNIAMKEIFWWAPTIGWLYNSVAEDLKVIWLVRDVRGWVSSFLEPEPNTHSDSIYEGWNYNTIDFWKRDYGACRLLNKIEPNKLNVIKDLLSNMSAPMHTRLAAMWTVDTALTKYYLEETHGKYFLVQYEHIAMNPFGTTQQIYNFVGQPIPDQLLRWLGKATKQGNMKDRYATFRESAKMAAIWTTRLSLQQILDIETIAGDLFDFFEYTPIMKLLGQ